MGIRCPNGIRRIPFANRIPFGDPISDPLFWSFLGSKNESRKKLKIHIFKKMESIFSEQFENSKAFNGEFEKKQDPAYSPHARFIVYRDDDDVFWGGSGYMMCFGLYVVYDNDAVWCFWLVGSRFFGPTPKQARSRSRAIPSRAVRAYTMPRKFPHAWEGHSCREKCCMHGACHSEKSPVRMERQIVRMEPRREKFRTQRA